MVYCLEKKANQTQEASAQSGTLWRPGKPKCVSGDCLFLQGLRAAFVGTAG